MLEIMKVAIEKLQLYIGESWQYALFLLALLYLLLRQEEKPNRKLFVGYAGVFALLYICPVTAKIIMDYCVGKLVYWRMFWLLPLPLVIAYVCTKIAVLPKRKMTRLLSMVIMAALIMVSGRFVYGESTPFSKAGNLLKLPPEVCWVCDTVKENSPELSEPGVVAPEELVSFIRQYDASIRLAYGRQGNRSKQSKAIAKEMRKEAPNFARIAKLAKKLNCSFLIYPEDKNKEEEIKAQGYVPVGVVNTYIIYKNEKFT